MAAVIKCYWDEDCSTPLDFEVLAYSMSLGHRVGFDGNKGDYTNQVVYLRNEGDVPATSTIVREVGDVPNYFFLSNDVEQNKDLLLRVGTINPGEVTSFSITSIIPKSTDAVEGIVNYVIEFYTLPSAQDVAYSHAYGNVEHKLHYSGDNPIPENARAGRPYGYGPYGVPNYGQEGLYKVKTVIDAILPVSGIAATYINATYSIKSRYKGTEATIEDVQSYYTDRYLALGCFDGPALPLWLNRDGDDEV